MLVRVTFGLQLFVSTLQGSLSHSHIPSSVATPLLGRKRGAPSRLLPNRNARHSVSFPLASHCQGPTCHPYDWVFGATLKLRSFRVFVRF